ncbi:hypothetical protein C8R47DRAFT_1231354 [Mycena vitilis]|nr:hypothetical protein C8R47DRAFT_1231354 [Mycena vitilis]
MPTCDRSVAQGSLFTYKDACEFYEQPPTATRRGHLERYRARAFGEVESIEPLVGNDGVVVKFRCPAEASRLEERMYMAQLHTLQTVVDTENIELGNHARLTWFVSPASGPPTNGGASDGFYLMKTADCWQEDVSVWIESIKPGMVMDAWFSIQRIDSLSIDGRKHRDYKLLATGLEHHGDGSDDSEDGVGYCVYCAELLL